MKTTLFLILITFSFFLNAQTYFPKLGITVGVFDYHPMGKIVITHVEKQCPVESESPIVGSEIISLNGEKIADISQLDFDKKLNELIDKNNLKQIEIQKKQPLGDNLYEQGSRTQQIIQIPTLKKEIKQSENNDKFYAKINCVPENSLKKDVFGTIYSNNGDYFTGYYLKSPKGASDGNAYRTSDWLLRYYDSKYSSSNSGSWIYFATEEDYKMGKVSSCFVNLESRIVVDQVLKYPIYKAAEVEVDVYIKGIEIGENTIYQLEGKSKKGLLLDGEFTIKLSQHAEKKLKGTFVDGFPVGEFVEEGTNNVKYIAPKRGTKEVLCSCGIVSTSGEKSGTIDEIDSRSFAEKVGLKKGYTFTGGYYKMYTVQSEPTFKLHGVCGTWGSINTKFKDGETQRWGAMLMYNIPLKIQQECDGNCDSGFGSKIMADGSWYSGNWKNAMPDGLGTWITENGNVVYKGNFKEGVKNGYGEESRLQELVYYLGNFINGKYDGYGELIYISPDLNGTSSPTNRLTGFFVEEKFKEGFNAKLFYDGFYDENQKPHGPGKISERFYYASGNFNHGLKEGEFIIKDPEDGVYFTTVYNCEVEDVFMRKWFWPKGEKMDAVTTAKYEQRLKEKLDDYDGYQRKQNEKNAILQQEYQEELKKLNAPATQKNADGKCPNCNGRGTIPETTEEMCYSCGGKGSTKCGSCSGSRFVYTIESGGKATSSYCGACRGWGTRSCFSCYGSGKKTSGHTKSKICDVCQGKGK